MKICPACRFDRCDDTAEWCRQCGADLSTLDEDDRVASMESAFFHYLQIKTIGTLELVPGQAMRIGHERRNELVLDVSEHDTIALRVGDYKLLLPTMWVSTLCFLLCRRWTLYLHPPIPGRDLKRSCQTRQVQRESTLR